MYRPILVTEPSATPVLAADVKAQVPSTAGYDDVLVTAFIDAAVSQLDGWTGILGRCLMPQTWRQDYDCWQRCMRLPLFPVISVTSVKYDDTDDAEQTVDSANYTLLSDERGSYIKFKQAYGFQAVNIERPAIRITYLAGYEDVDHIPAAIKTAICLMVGNVVAPIVRQVSHGDLSVSFWTDTMASGGGTMPPAVAWLIAPFRRLSV